MLVCTDELYLFYFLIYFLAVIEETNLLTV